MEICSTPPPADQEDIIAAETEEPKKQFTASVKPKKPKEDEGEKSEAGAIEHRSNDVEAPPPPKISNPSPPPPPRIFAEDLQKDKQHRDKEVSLPDTKPLEMVSSSSQAPTLPPQNPMISNAANTEPLPPGVDIPEAPYEIPAAALKRILYNTVQGASLYEAAARDPTVPILGHHIVQEHYLQYPAYHQHLHAPTALVLPHKHGVQPAIQLIPDYTPIYTNHKVIEKPPVKTRKESLVSALDSFYSDIAQIEKTRSDANNQKQETTQAEVTTSTVATEETKVEGEHMQPVPEAVAKDKKRKKARIAISKKHKEVSSMVAKWQRAQQHLEDNA